MDSIRRKSPIGIPHEKKDTFIFVVNLRTLIVNAYTHKKPMDTGRLCGKHHIEEYKIGRNLIGLGSESAWRPPRKRSTAGSERSDFHGVPSNKAAKSAFCSTTCERFDEAS
jgi:hypothetical protein